MSERDVTIRLRLRDGQKVEDALQKLGGRGQAALQKVERASKPASKGLLVLNQAVGNVKDSATGLAANAGGLGSVLGRLGPVGIAIGAGLGAAVIGMNLMIEAARIAVKEFSDLANAADKLGVTVESLQELRFAAEQNGVATANFDTSLQRFTRRLADAQNGTGTLKAEFEALGIAVKNADGTNRTATAVLDDFADAMQRTGNQGERIRLAFAAFDTEGVDMVRVLKDGSQGLDDYAAAARNAGAVVDGHLVESARATGDELNRLEQQNSALLGQIGETFSGWLIAFEEVKGKILRAINDILDAFRNDDERSTASLQGEIDELISARAEMEKSLASIRGKITDPSRIDVTGRDTAILKEVEQGLLDDMEASLERQAAIQKRLDELARQRAERETSTGTPTAGGAPAKLSDPEKVIADLEFKLAQAERSDGSKSFRAALKQAGLEDTTIVDNEHTARIFELTAALQRLAKAEQDAADISKAHTEGRRALAALDGPEEKRIAALRHIADLERMGAITAEERARLVTAAEEAADRARADARRAVDGLVTAEEKRLAALRKISDLEKQGLITAEERLRLVAEAEKKAEDERLENSEETSDGIRRALRDMAEEAEDSADRAERALKGAFDAAGDSIEDMVKQGKVDLESLGEAVFDLLFEIAAAEAQKQIVKPVISFIGSALGLVAADGAVMDRGMPVTPFRKGGVTTGPTFFPMANGQAGLMGEDGEEAIMPLKRTPDGALGVRAVLPDMRGAGGGGVTVVFAPTIRVEVAGGGSGDAAAARKFGEQISEQITGALLEMVDERIVDQMRVGGIINPLGDRRFGA